MAASRQLPVVVVLGATGTGKSKLSIELGRAFKGEIISADSMQVYKGLDIITNKVTEEEQSQCRHHMLDFLSPLQANYNVVKFRNTSLPIINSLLEKSRVPIIVGGTNYYIESLLWKLLIDSEIVSKASVTGDCTNTDHDQIKTAHCNAILDGARVDDLGPEDGGQPHAENPENPEITASVEVGSSDSDTDDAINDKLHKHLEEQETSVLYKRLHEIDPVTALRTHPNERRKILRAVEVYEQHGVPISEIYSTQHCGVSEAVSGGLRFLNTCVFWLRCDRTVLNERLDRRVDTMIERGLVQELTDFHQHYNHERIKDGRPPDYCRGIFQSIGFKEFHEYLVLTPEVKSSEKGKQLLKKGIEDLKTATRQYARRQEQWIRRRFLQRPGTDVPDVYGLEATDVSQWDTLVNKPAVDILSAVLKGETPPVKPIPRLGNRAIKMAYNVCEICDGKIFTLEDQYLDHLKSKRHKKRVAAIHRRKHWELQKLSRTLDTIAAAGTRQSSKTKEIQKGSSTEEEEDLEET